MRKEDLRIATGLTTNMIANMGKGKNISMVDVIELEQDKEAEISN